MFTLFYNVMARGKESKNTNNVLLNRLLESNRIGVIKDIFTVVTKVIDALLLLDGFLFWRFTIYDYCYW
jgi:hypothetical protein